MKTVGALVEFAANVEGQGTEDNQNCTYTRAELEVLAASVTNLPRRARIVEIGTFGGRSASLYFQLQPEQQFDIHLVDNWSWNAIFANQIFSKLIIDHFSEAPFTLHKTRSDELGPRWNLPVDFLHVDGWHDLPGIEPDCQLWLPWVVPGGTAAFHDSDWPDVAGCIEKYVKQAGWSPVGHAGRTTAWKKPNA